MKTKQGLLLLAGFAVFLMAAVFFLASCGGGDDDSGNEDNTQTVSSFTSLIDLTVWLQEQPDNTAKTPYKVKLTDVGLSSLESLFNALSGKYVSIDISRLDSTSIWNNEQSTSRQNSDKLVSISLPLLLTSIGNNAFMGCSSLTEVTIPSTVTSIGYNAFRDCSSLTEVTIPAAVTRIGESAFRGCKSLTEVTIPSTDTSIAREAFMGCSSLTEVTIPSTVTLIGESAFRGCSSLTEVTIPAAVLYIEAYAFSGCSSLTEVRCNAATPPRLSNNNYFNSYPFDNADPNLQIKVPGDSVSEYKTAWNRYADLIVAQ